MQILGLDRWVWFGWVLWHINHFRLSNAKLSLYKYIRCIRFVNTFCWSYLPNPSARVGYDTWSIFKLKFNRFSIQSFPSPRLVALLRLKKPSLSYYLPIAGGRIIGFIPFPRVLVLLMMFLNEPVKCSKLFYFKQFSLKQVICLLAVLNVKQFYLTYRYESNQVLPLWTRIDQGTMAIKEYSTLSKALALLETSPSNCLTSYPGKLDRGV